MEVKIHTHTQTKNLGCWEESRKKLHYCFTFFFQMYLQQANQKDMIFNVIDVLSQPPTEMLDFLYSKRKKNKFLLFEIFNDIYFIKHRCKYALIRYNVF